MAGNTRGKLKEHFEGIHRNFDWCAAHINKSLELIANQLREVEVTRNPQVTEEEVAKVIAEYPLFNGIKSLGKGIEKLDELAMGVYSKL